MTQKEMVLQFLEEEKSITPLKALKEFGIMRLSAVIYDLKRLGYIITTEKEKSVNRYGKTVYYARYFLIKGE